MDQDNWTLFSFRVLEHAFYEVENATHERPVGHDDIKKKFGVK